VEFRILGPFEAVRDGRAVVLGGAQQRALLALLVLHRGEVLSTDRLIDELWGERPPPTGHKTVQVYVSNLRRVLGEGVIVTRGHGYVLAAEAGEVDAGKFEALVDEGRRALDDGDPALASARLGAALALWRGAPLADLAYEPFTQREIARLEEARLAALEDRTEADLALGSHAALVAGLESLVAAHPLRERPRTQLMLALYRSGRQADALECYSTARRELIDQLGIEPGPALQKLQRAILAHDPALDPPRDRPGTPRNGRRMPSVRGGRLIVAGAGVLLGAAIAAAGLALSASSGGFRVEPNSVVAIDPSSNSIVGEVPVGTRPAGLGFGTGSLWVANLDDHTVTRIDPAMLQPLRTLPVAGTPTGIAASPNAVWVVGSDPTASNVSVTRIDPEFNVIALSDRIGNIVPGGPGSVATYGNTVWVAPSSGLLARLDPTTGRVAQRVDPNAGPAGIAIGDGAVWITDTDANNVTRVDPTGLLTPIAVGSGPTGLAVGEGGVWVADTLDNAIVKIDPSTRSVAATIPVGRSPAGVAVGAGSVWVSNRGDGTVTRIDPRTDKVLATIKIGGSPQAIVVADRRAWVTVDAQTIGPPELAASGGTIRIESQSDVDFMDPALAYTALSDQLLYATCAKLLNYPDRPGLAGSQLKPEVAQSLPARSGDGKTYTFTIRSGFRFSPPSNQPVTAQTFRDTIERTLNPRMHSPIAGDVADIAGAGAYMAGKSAHIAGVIAQGDRLTIHLTAPVPDFPARIAEPAFCAVPSNTPIEPGGVRLIPSAGPYYVASYTPGQGVLLVRNPNYHGSRPRRFARIELAVGIPAAQAVADVQAGAADYTSLGLRSLSPASGPASTIVTLAAQLSARFGSASRVAERGQQRYFVHPMLQLDYFDLNTHRSLFRNARMRQAVNYAIDRRALAQLGSGFQPLPERPTDHYLPPGMPGFTDAHIYPLTPDPAKARQLAKGKGRIAVLYTCDIEPCVQQAQIVKTDLAAIGLHVEIKTFPFAILFARVARPGEPFDLAYSGWLPDYLDPSAMLVSMLEDSSFYPTFDDPIYQRRLRAAATLSGPERYLAYERLDIDLARNAAPLVAYGNLSFHDFFSSRTGCQTYNLYGVDLAALCIRRQTR
jgi:YVTN family beta-propeller protein